MESKVNIINKATMYRLLRSGQLGNTNRSWASLDHYLRDQEKEKKTVGIRSTKPGGLCLYHVPYNDVWGKIVKHWPNGGYNISEMMNDEDIKYQGEYCGLGRVLTISRVKKPMREALLEYQYNYQGYKAETILFSGMNDKSRGMFEELVLEYPDHVIEFSVYNRSVGVMPGHNTIIWEVRMY